jgi:hypothetical protein
MKKIISLFLILVIIASGVGFGMASLSFGASTKTSISVYISGLQYPDSAYDYFKFSLNGSWTTQSSSSKTWSGLSCGTSYSFGAIACYNGIEYDMGGFSASTDACDPPPSPPSPTAPSSVSGSVLNSTSAQISWSGGSPTYYDIELRRSDGTLIDSWTLSGVYQLTKSGLMENTSYYARVRTREWYSYGGYYVYSSWTVGNTFTTPGDTTPPTPDPILSVTVTGVDSDSATVTWTGGNNHSYYRVNMKVNGSTQVWQQVTSKTATFNNLQPNTTYTACVFGCERTNNCSAEVCSAAFTTDQSLDAWEWSIPITANAPVYQTTKVGNDYIAYIIPATEWNQFTAKINELRVAKGLSNYSFTQVSSGTNFTYQIMNQAITALNQIGNSLELASIGDIKAQHFIDIRDTYNDGINSL